MKAQIKRMTEVMSLRRLNLVSLIMVSIFRVQPTHGAPTQPIFSPPQGKLSWRVVNDTVMGGRSRSQGREGAQGELIFEGQLSLENNGGFTSIRSSEIAHLDERVTHIRLRVRGDGRRYRLLLRSTQTSRGVSYQHPFQTRADEWVSVELPLAAFQARWRGRSISDAPALRATEIRSVGFLLADRRAGPFRLSLSEMHGTRP